MAGKVGKVNDACRSRWAASGGGGGSGFQLMLGNASVIVKPMPASQAGKFEIGDVGDELKGTSIGDEVVRVPAMRMPTPC